MKIIGAGLAGLIAAQVFQKATVVEAAPCPIQTHKALLRFRSRAVADLTGIEFKAVKVRKAIFDGQREIPPSIRAANAYALKCLNKVSDRSIWDLEPVTRYIAPEDFYDQLIEATENRILWGKAATFTGDEPKISTAPLPVVCEALGIDLGVQFDRAPITVARFRIPRCDVYQTIYFPFMETSMYRASITGDILIVEFIGHQRGLWMQMLEKAFQLPDAIPLETVAQRYGKIAPIDEDVRRAAIPVLTQKHNIYSIGRFATWRNILLDDVVRDAAVIKKLLASDEHSRRLISIKEN
jgi:hypothetical protein